MFKEIKLDNGLTVVYEHLPHVRSVSFGVWIGAGSRYENPENNGISHFIEHMVFKGTEKRSALQIACEFDGIGGQINAFTSKDCTCYYSKTLDSDLEKAIEIIADMLFGSVYDEAHLKTEREVIFEEINMYEDDPEEMVHDILTEEIWKGWSLGYPILGTKDSLSRINKQHIRDYLSQYYVPDNGVISVVGNFNEDKLLELIQNYFGAWKPKNKTMISDISPTFQPCLTYRSKNTEQTHICLGYNGVSMGDERSFAVLVLNNILGGGMSSRLFQKIREERGLAYSIYSFPSSFSDVGMLSIYAGTNPDKADEVMKLIHDELVTLCQGGISEEELNRSKNQLKGNFMLSLDSTSGRMTSAGKARLITGEVKSTEEILMRIESVNQDNVLHLAKSLFQKGQTGVAVLGQSDINASVLGLFMK